jgi:hypothetical protein
VSKAPVIPIEPGVIAVLHRTDSTWRGLIANTRGLRPTVVGTHDFPVDQAGRIDSWLNEHHVEDVLCVLPAAAVIARNCTLPNAPPEQLQQALGLQAEAHLLGLAPSHRLGMAVLPNSNGETSRTGIILAWPDAAQFSAPPISRRVRYVPDVAAIAALLNGSRPTEPLIWMDRTDGSIALALSHTGGAVFRGTREDASSSDAWQKSVSRVMAETGLSVGHTGPFVENLANGARQMAASLQPNQSALFVPRDVMATTAQRVQGAGSDNRWWSRYGIALGAVLARSGPLAPLTQFLAAPPIERPSRVRSFVASLSQPRTAMRLVVLALLVLAIGPIVVHGVRWAALKVRFGNLQEQVKAVNEYKHQVSMYNAMRDQKVWPMTKLLADIATNTPEGIDLESMRIEHGSEFAVQGTARDNAGKKATELVAQMQADLHATGIFSDVVYDWGEGNSMGVYKFNLSGKVANAYKQKEYDVAHDYAAWTLQYRQAGKPAPSKDAVAKAGDETKPATPALPDPNQGTLVKAGDEDIDVADPKGAGHEAPLEVNAGTSANGADVPGDGRPERPGRRPTGTAVPIGGTAGDPGDAGMAPLPPSKVIPAAISQEEIEKMPLPEANAHLQQVSVARKNAALTPEEKARLKKEFEMLLAHITKLKSS